MTELPNRLLSASRYVITDSGALLTIDGSVTTSHAIPGLFTTAISLRKPSGDDLCPFPTGSDLIVRTLAMKEIRLVVKYLLTLFINHNGPGPNNLLNSLPFPVLLLHHQLGQLPNQRRRKLGFTSIRNEISYQDIFVRLPLPVSSEDPRWILASPSSSLYGIRDHTLQLSEGINFIHFKSGSL